jgi:hypothetical protein
MHIFVGDYLTAAVMCIEEKLNEVKLELDLFEFVLDSSVTTEQPDRLAESNSATGWKC